VASIKYNEEVADLLVSIPWINAERTSLGNSFKNLSFINSLFHE